ncbi:MAG: sugar ABC transporter permease [Clostridia bacterium]|nr:sugar ABC transporter permease [Clostridia bacterium]MDY2713793.1 sugar ABC transporter permease [Christensenellaceae bacterium]MDY3725152.1 sugar ABC transporter permease [Christensenellaceae bacterium]
MNLVTGKKQLSLRTKRLIFVWSMLALPILQFVVFFIYVNINSFFMSFQNVNYGTGKIEWSLVNYKRFFYELTHFDNFRRAILNSLWAGGNNLLLLVLSLVFAYFFYKKVPGGKVFRIVFFIPSIISIVVYTMVYKYMFDSELGPVNKLLQLLGVPDKNIPIWFNDKRYAYSLVMFYCLWVGVGYNILIYGGAMANVSTDVIEYGRLEGVNMRQELFLLIVPMMWPTIAVSLLGCVSVIFSLFIQVQMLTGGGPDNSSITIAYIINSQIKGSSANPEWATCIGWCFAVVATPILILMRKGIDKLSDEFGF